MQLKSFLEGYPRVVFGDEQDSIFVALRFFTHGMCSARMAKLLNFACQFLAEDECYLEIGTYAGFTLLSAGYESSHNFVGVDNFSANWSIRGDVKCQLEKNIQAYPGNYHIVDSDFRRVNLTQMQQKVGVFLVDGDHTYEDVMDSIAVFKDRLSDNALIVFDDINVPGVRKAIDEIKKDDAFTEFFFANSFGGPDGANGMRTCPYIHNGFSLMSYQKKESATQ